MNEVQTDNGLIRKNELAMKYFTKASTPKLACNNLRRWIKRCDALMSELEKSNYNPHEWYFTPQQVKLIYLYLGEPE